MSSCGWLLVDCVGCWMTVSVGPEYHTPETGSHRQLSVQLIPPNGRFVTTRGRLTARAQRFASPFPILMVPNAHPQTLPAVPISFTIEPTTGLLRTVVTGRFGRDDLAAYASELRAHPETDRIERRLVDVRPSAVVSSDELLDLLVVEQDAAGPGRRADRRAILLNSDNGPALGRELVVSTRRTSSMPVAYRVFRSSVHAYRYLRVEPKLLAERARKVVK